MSPTVTPMLDSANVIADEIVRLRRDFHTHPELGFQEFRTARVVADTLREIGLDDIREGIGRTGVVAQIGSGDGPTIGLRADMDALPIEENSGVPFSSQRPGVMHACGHDAHTAILLGVAHLLRQSYANEKWRGNVRFLFQPSEESFDADDVCGAMAMIADGALEGVDHTVSLHVASQLPLGHIFTQDGYARAASDTFQVWIRGTGSHAATPHRGTDPIQMLASVLPAIYAIPSRRISALRPAVVSIGQIHAGAASNIIPETVFIEGTMRSYDPDVRLQLRIELENAVRVVEALGGTVELRIRPWFTALYNDPDVNRWVRAVSADIVGADHVRDLEFGMGSEDFAFMAEIAPGTQFVVGAALDDHIDRPHHTDRFAIDERALPIGAAILAETARRYVTGTFD